MPSTRAENAFATMTPPPNPAESHDGPSAGAGEAQISKRFTGCNTIGEMWLRVMEGPMERTRRYLPPVDHEEMWRPLRRYCEPWPDWVLRIAAEVLHVHFPTISKSTIEGVLRYFHFISLVARVDGSNQELRPPTPEMNPKILGALIGMFCGSRWFTRSWTGVHGLNLPI